MHLNTKVNLHPHPQNPLNSSPDPSHQSLFFPNILKFIMDENSEHLKVAIRVRPILDIDKVQDSSIFLGDVISP